MKETNKFFNKIKSKLILWKIFNSIKQNKLYKIIQYNKRLQNKLGLSINDFKRYTQIEIEVEIIPEKNITRATPTIILLIQIYSLNLIIIFFLMVIIKKKRIDLLLLCLKK